MRPIDAIRAQGPAGWELAPLIDGRYVRGSRCFAVHNPANQETLYEVGEADAELTLAAIQSAERAQPAWRATLAAHRSQILRRWAQLLAAHRENLARLMAVEMGKPVREAETEAAITAQFADWFADEARRIYGDIVPPHRPDARVLVTKEPIGVTAGITPWNFPAAMVTRKAAPALAAGCTMVLKPAEDAPGTALYIAQLALEAGVPPGVLNVVPCRRELAPELGEILATSPTIRKISFTGSTEVGKTLMRLASGTVKKVSLELGGNAPFIVFDDANLDAAVDGAMVCKFRNAGQTCVCANRILVQKNVYAAFRDKLAERIRAYTLGDPILPETDCGPLINPRAYDKVASLVGEALADGARALVGGQGAASHGRLYWQPTLLEHVQPTMRIAREEIFGPVAALIPFETDAEALFMANDTPSGLAAYFYAKDMRRIMDVCEKLDYGIIGVNTGLISTEVAPFGGMKESGLGREGSKYGIEDWLEIKYICLVADGSA